MDLWTCKISIIYVHVSLCLKAILVHLMILSTLMQQFISMTGLNVPASSTMGGVAVGASPSVDVAQGTTPAMPKGSPEDANMYKHLKPLVFKGKRQRSQ